MPDEANLPYRQNRRNFIAACEAAGTDAISRVHPGHGPDGKPLFCDSAAFGPRDAARALLVIADAGGAVIPLLQDIRLPNDARLVVIHALDPYAATWGKPGAPADWPQKTLATIAAEDLSKVKKLTMLDMDGSASQPALAAALPGAIITFRAVRPEHSWQAISAAIAAL